MLTSAQPKIREDEAEVAEVPLRFHAAEPEEIAAVAPRSAGYLMVKGVCEWMFAMSLIISTAPLVVVLAVLVKLSSRGPAFYAQTRLGKEGREYRIFKLRTMVHNAEAKTGAVWASKDDVRITPIGVLLRKTHLDELPQLWNVVRGEMSLIGPRPERPEIASFIEQDLPEYRNRLAVKPGITGLAQMLVGPDDPEDPMLRSVRRKLAHDLYYVRELDWKMDLRIALSTPCYFLASAVECVQRKMVWKLGVAVRKEMTSVLPAEDVRK